VSTTLQQSPPGQPPAVKIVVPNNRRMRALSTTVLHCRTSPHADETARVKRDEARRSETKTVSRDRVSPREFSTRVQHCKYINMRGFRHRDKKAFARRTSHTTSLAVSSSCDALCLVPAATTVELRTGIRVFSTLRAQVNSRQMSRNAIRMDRQLYYALIRGRGGLCFRYAFHAVVWTRRFG
jgi:hypothetical protein